VLNVIIIAAVGIGIALVAAMVVVLVIADRRNRRFESRPPDTSYGYETERYTESPGSDLGKAESPQLADAINRMFSQKKLKKALLLSMPIFIAEGIAIFIGARMLVLSKASLDWPTAAGLVLSSQVEEDYDSEDGYTYYPQVAYQYTVDGQAYESERVFFGLGSAPEEDAYEIVARFPAGSAAAVYYNPDKPQQAVLVPGNEYAPRYLIVIGVIMMVISTAGFGFLLFKVSRGEIAVEE
jgi:hypothetical protein